MVRGCPFRIAAELGVSGVSSMQRNKDRETDTKDCKGNQKMAVGEDGPGLPPRERRPVRGSPGLVKEWHGWIVIVRVELAQP
jgi:hypothetical protein